MVKAQGMPPSRRRGGHGPLANKRAADRHAKALAATIQEIRRAGYTTRQDICDELNRLEAPTGRGGEGSEPNRRSTLDIHEDALGTAYMLRRIQERRPARKCPCRSRTQ